MKNEYMLCFKEINKAVSIEQKDC